MVVAMTSALAVIKRGFFFNCALHLSPHSDCQAIHTVLMEHNSKKKSHLNERAKNNGQLSSSFYQPPPFINGSVRCHVCPRSRGREKRKIMCKRLQFVCQWRQRGCQSLQSPQMLKIGSLNEGLCFEEAILMERLAACFLKWLCWHEVRLHHCLCLTKCSTLVLVHSKALSSNLSTGQSPQLPRSLYRTCLLSK